MKKRLLLILLTMVSVMAARSEDRVILDWGRNVPWEMKYVFQESDEGIAPNGKVSISNNQFTNKRLETVILPDVSGITTGIRYVDANTFDNKAPAYSIQGIKTQTPKRGVYIRDGKKIVVK